MNIDAETFRRIVKPIFPDRAALSADEAAAIAQLAYLAADADLDEDTQELLLCTQLGRHVCALGGISFESVPRPSPVPLPIDDEARMEWLAKISRRLGTTEARELGYVIAYLLAVGDLALAPVETIFITELQHILGVRNARASELVAHASAAVTPLEASESRDRGAEQRDSSSS